MMKKLLLLLAIGALPIVSFAQGALTIFSEDGDRFYLVLNGVKQNPTPQTNVRVDGLINDYYSAKILFEDNTKPEISKNIPVKDATSNEFADMTYKIKRTNKGELKIRYFSATPMPPSYNPPPDMYYVHFGTVPPPPPGAGVQTTTTTTITTDDQPTGGNVNINAGLGGVNLSVNVNDGSNGAGGVNMNMNINI